MANLAYRSSSSASDSSASQSNLTVNTPAGVVENDLLVAQFASLISGGGSPREHTTPSGWTLLRSEPTTLLGGAVAARIDMYYRIAGSSEPSTHTFLTSGTCLALGAVINAYDNPDTSTPYQASSITTVTGSGTSISLAGITTANPNVLLVGAVYSDGGGTPSTFTSGDLSERIDSASLWLGDTLQAIAGASGNKAVTASNSGVYRGFLAAFNSEPAAPSGPTINTHPSNQTVTEPATASFTVSATTSGGSLSYQWQVDTGSGFANVSTGSGGTTSSYTTAATDVTHSGYEYRCVVTDSNGSTNSNAATLTVNAGAPTINSHPSNQTVTEPATATFSVSATASEGSLSYQWQVNSGGGWGNVSTGSGGTTASYTTAATTTSMSGYQYRCAVSDTNGTTNSNAATLTVNEDEPPPPSGGGGLLLLGVG